MALLRIVTDDGIEGNAFLGSALGSAATDAPMLIERFKNEGLIDLDRDTTRLRTEDYYNTEVA